MFNDDTIVAPATPPGEGGIAILRLSGSQASAILRRVFQPSRSQGTPKSHRLYHGHLVGPDGKSVDEVLAVLMRGPHSYTREDIVEIHCHGGSLPLRKALDLCIDSGARLARPGEFTLRAFLNGRLDLAQAEAVIDLIRARSDAAGQVALGQLEGRLSRFVHDLKAPLVHALALFEAHIDFPEEDLGDDQLSPVVSSLEKVIAEIDRLLENFDAGRVLREGLSILLLGRPNVGKSSLLNALLGEARAIVTDIPGTTRDTIEESLVLNGVPIRLVDTAGVRDSADPIEAEGVRRAQSKIDTADLVLLVVDGSGPLHREDLTALELCGGAPVLVVANKCDLAPPAPNEATLPHPLISISARTGEGLDRLKDLIVQQALGRDLAEVREDVMICERRHREALVHAREALRRFLLEARNTTSLEFLALELREALQAIGDITGETTPDEVLDQIFSKFCIGK